MRLGKVKIAENGDIKLTVICMKTKKPSEHLCPIRAQKERVCKTRKLRVDLATPPHRARLGKKNLAQKE